MSAWDTPSCDSCRRWHSRSAFMLGRLCSISTCKASILIPASFSSMLIFLSSNSDCLSLNLLSCCICSFLRCDSSLKSDGKLVGDDRNFFLSDGTALAVHLILIVSTATGLLSTPLSLTSQSITCTVELQWLVRDCLKNFLVVVKTLLATEQKSLPLILCNCEHYLLKATLMNVVLTTRTMTCLQGFILFKAPCA